MHTIGKAIRPFFTDPVTICVVVIKRYSSTIQVGIVVNVLCATQNSAFKNHPTDILLGKNHLCGIVLVHIIHKTALNATKHLQGARYNFF